MKLTLNVVEIFVVEHKGNKQFLVTCEYDVEVLYDNTNVPQLVLDYINDHKPYRIDTQIKNTIVSHYKIENLMRITDEITNGGY